MSAAGTPTSLPAGACDGHVHFYGTLGRYPPRTVDGLPPQRGSAADYGAMMQRVGLQRVVAVQSILCGFDDAATAAAGCTWPPRGTCRAIRARDDYDDTAAHAAMIQEERT